jgi:hypothetical protein
VERYTYVSVGKIIPYTSKREIIIPWVTRCFRIAGDRAAIHGLGVTNWTLLRCFPWYSVVLQCHIAKKEVSLAGR